MPVLIATILLCGLELFHHYLAHHELPDLASHCHRVGINEPHVARNFEMRNSVPAVSADFFLVGEGASFQLNPCA